MGKYILNQETQKIELHFDKSEYLDLPDAQKKKIKSNFLWKRTVGAWVSRSTKDHYWALKIAEELGLENGGKEGTRLSYAEELEQKAERAEARAERFDTYADNAEKRGKNLTAALESHHGDIAFFTQPIIPGHAGSQSFARQRERIYARFDKGMDEYRKSAYFQDRAATAQRTANNGQLKNPIYLHNRIKEQTATIKKLEKYAAQYEDRLSRIQQGETLKNYRSGVITDERMKTAIRENLEKMEYEIDKLAFFENALEEIGGNQFSRENIKVGYIVNMRRWGRCEIISAGPVNVGFKILDGGAAGGFLTEPYAAITEIIKTVEPAEKSAKIQNPFRIGDILCRYYGMDARNGVYMAFQVIKITATGVKIQPIAIEDRKPIPGKFTGKPIQKKVVKSKWSEFVGVYEENQKLDMYTPKEG